MSDKIYARLENNEIKEYPVYPVHIQTRAHPLEWYTEVEFREKPAVPEFHYLQETLEVYNDQFNKVNRVMASYSVKPYNLDALLANLWQAANAAVPGEQVDVQIQNINPIFVQRVAELATAAAQTKLDQFANQRSYDTIVTAISYLNSQNPTFKADADRATAVRDQVWVALYQYLEKVTTGQLPVPKSSDDIFVHVPTPTWTA